MHHVGLMRQLGGFKGSSKTPEAAGAYIGGGLPTGSYQIRKMEKISLCGDAQRGQFET